MTVLYSVTAYLELASANVNKPDNSCVVSRNSVQRILTSATLSLRKAMDARHRAFVLFANHFLESDEEESDEDSEPGFVDVYDVRSSDDEEETRPTLFGGYDFEFVDKVLDSQTCPVCLLPMRDAVQTTECGHRFCKDCLLGILR